MGKSVSWAARGIWNKHHQSVFSSKSHSRMHHADLTMVDFSNDAWFDLVLNNYQNQLVNGYTRMTPEAGLQIFMPDLGNLPKNTRKPEH
jgi:hypothetical protein